MSDFLGTHCHCSDDDDDGGGKDASNKYDTRILATQKSTASKSCSLIFLHAKDGLAFITHLTKHYKFILLGLNKVYLVTEGNGSIIRGDFTSIKESSEGANNDDKSINQFLFSKLVGLRKLPQHPSTSNPKKIRPVVVKVSLFV